MAVVSLQRTEVRMKVTKLQRSMEDLNFSINQIKCYMTKTIKGEVKKRQKRGKGKEGEERKKKEKKKLLKLLHCP